MRPERSRLAATDLPRPFVFAMGSPSPNKNTDLLLAMSEALRAAGLHLVMAGGVNSNVFRKPIHAGAANVLQLGRVDDQDVAYLYTQALCFAFPSLYEGFGIPAIEAMAFGCPVVASNSSALPEVLGDAALFCPPTDMQSWLSAITRLACEPDLRAQMVWRGRQRAGLYSWRKVALRLLEVVRTLAST
jgi:glycosyltransferase involved in cell wall biosynthesis